MEEITKEQFFAKIDEEIKKMPSNWRKGQKIFNAVDIIFGIAREVQFHHGVDCFYDDSKIDSFKDKAYEVYKEYFKNIEKMTQEEKAKTYDEALERMKSWVRGKYPGRFTTVEKVAEFIFPELKKSEDERAWLTKYLQEEIDCLRYDIRDYEDSAKLDNLQRALAWLENQGKKQKLWDIC